MILDLARKWQLNFQDPATPLMKGLIDLHHNIMFILILIFGLVTSHLAKENLIEASSLLAFIFPLKLRFLIVKYGELRQKIYDKFSLFCFDYKILKSLLLFHHRFLLLFRYITEHYGNKIENYISLNMLALITSIICSRLHIAGYMLFVILFLIRLDYAVVSMCLFYKRYPTLQKHLLGPTVHKRYMFKIVGKIIETSGKVIEEAAHNPKVQATAVAAVGAVAWKALDVWDTHKQEVLSAADREAAERTANADREAAERTANADREAAERTATADREAAERTANADREEARLSREQAERHHEDEMAMRQKELDSSTKT